MTNQAFNLNLSITVKAPFVIHSSEPGGFGIDSAIMRDPDGCPIIPGTLLVGKMRDAWDLFGQEKLIAEWLGGKASKFQPKPGRLCEADLRLDGWKPESEPRQETTRVEIDDAAHQPATKPWQACQQLTTRVEIDDLTGAGESGSLMVIEQPWAIAQKLNFNGTWRVIGSEEEVKRLCNAACGALRWMSQVGAEASVGWGELVDIDISCKPASSSNTSKTIQVDAVPERLYYALYCDDPMCFPDKVLGDDNLFESSDVIPGNAIKAALALTWGAYEGKFGNEVEETEFSTHPKLAASFWKMGFSHAMPSHTKERPLPVPQSFAWADDQLWDVALLEEPHLLNGQAPAFPIDWKTKAGMAANAIRKWGATHKDLRLRTAMDYEKARSKESELFAYECIRSVRKIDNQRVPITRWLGWIDFSFETDRDEREQLIASAKQLLDKGLHFLGKTKAVAKIDWLDEQPETWPSNLAIENGGWRVMLSTPALLTPIDQLQNDSTTLFDAYANYWNEKSFGSLTLSHYFAWQRLAGGKYAWERRQKPVLKKDYRPWILTLRGSVFFLKPTGDETTATAHLRKWRKAGLPLSTKVLECYAPNVEEESLWKHLPYVPQNGFGEIAVNANTGVNLCVSIEKVKEYEYATIP